MQEISNFIRSHNHKNSFSFDEESHKYYIGNKEISSVTEKKQTYFPFNVDKVSRVVAEKNWTTEDDVKDDWEILKNNGIGIHKLAEMYLNQEDLSQDDLSKIGHVINFLKDNPHYEIIDTETKIFSSKFSVAGTIDLIVRDTDTGRLYTIDWKTCQKEIKRNIYWEMAKPPFEEIPNNKFFQFSLQLWTYNLILEKEYGIQIWDSFIVHLKNDLETYEIIEPAQLIYEAEMLLKSN